LRSFICGERLDVTGRDVEKCGASGAAARLVYGTWHHISAKHLAAYLDEMTFRFNRRNNADLFLDTLRHMVTASTLTLENLTPDLPLNKNLEYTFLADRV
jgi:hypothetical protein